MIGHTKATAGVAGLIKAALALHHRVLPPTIGVTEPNPKANFADSPFYVNTEARPWLARPDGQPRRAGGQRVRLRRHQLPHRARGVHRRLPAATPRRPSNAGPPSCCCGAALRTRSPARWRSLAAQLDAGAEPELADLALTLGQARAGAGRRPGRAGAGRRVARRPADQARRRARAAGAATPARLHAPHGIHYAPTPLAADGRRRLPVPRPGLAERRHGPRAGAGLPRGA